MDEVKVGQIGYGFVGSALHKSFNKRGLRTTVYDKYALPPGLYLIEEDLGYYPYSEFEELLDSDIIFLCLPTPFIAGHGFDIGALLESCKRLKRAGYTGAVVIKSTVEPGITQQIADKFPEMTFCHNPEFLTARTALMDFDNQTHIVLGVANNNNRENHIVIHLDGTVGNLYRKLYPNAEISICTSEESESMKIFANNFYAMKVQIFNEFRYLCQKTGADFETVKEMMIKNGWINPMHTLVPGPDGMPSYGGACFPKDTNALYHLMKTLGSPHKVLEACIEERNEMRETKWK